MLLESHHSVEAIVLLRTVDDFVDEVTFVLDAMGRDSATKPQAAFLKAFFEEDVRRPEQLLEERRGPDRAKKRQIQAAQGRYLDPSNPDRFRRVARAIDDTFSGYVHGAYPHSMELWVGDTYGNGHFTLRGTKGANHTESYWRQHAFYVSRALSVAGMVTMHCGRLDLKNAAKAARDRFEAFVEDVLEIEHRIISQHRAMADLVIPPDFDHILANGN